MSETLERVLEEVKELSPEEQRQLRDQIDLFIKKEEGSSSREALLRALYEQGAVKEIKSKPSDFKSYQDFRPQPLEGQPVSETLIEERR